MDLEKLSPEKLLAAGSAVLTMWSVLDAVKTAPHGHGMACVESVLYDKGFDRLRNMLRAASASVCTGAATVLGAIRMQGVVRETSRVTAK